MSGKSLIIFGFVVTFLFLGACTYLAFLPYCEIGSGQELCINNFQIFIASPPNEKGDTLAGLAGSLAFLWIIITVLLQANELSLQRSELKQTREALERQTLFLDNQDKDRIAANVDRTVDAKMNLLLDKLPDLAFDKFLISKSDGTNEIKNITFLTKSNFSENDLPKDYAKAIEKTVKTLQTRVDDGWEVVQPPKPISWYICQKLSEEICCEVYEGSEGKKEEIVFGNGVCSLNKALKEALECDHIWGTDTKKLSS